MDKIDQNYKTTDNLYDIVHDLYTDKEDFYLDKHFLMDNVYHKKTEIKYRTNQNDFRKKLIETYKVCIVTGFSDIDELEACHIVPCTESNTHIDNGILLNRMIHKTFDKYLWSIHPESFHIEISNNINRNSSILQYKDKIIPIRKESIYYINKHYLQFKKLSI